ncbi:MAG: RCC1 domain-containing protein [Nannocystales bacterium]
MSTRACRWTDSLLGLLFAAGCGGTPVEPIDFGLGDTGSSTLGGGSPAGTTGLSSASSASDTSGEAQGTDSDSAAQDDSSSDGGSSGDDGTTGDHGADGVVPNRISMGHGRACAIVEGNAWCWGSNEYGQAGDGTLDPALSPVAVQGLPEPVLAIHAGSNHTCALSDAGAVHCWGGNWNGQLGRGNAADSVSPGPVVGLDSGVLDLSVGGSHACARLDEGSVQCWGFNSDGQVGSGGFGNTAVPALVALDEPAIAVGTGVNHSCAVVHSGGLWCWGENEYGQLGDGGMLYDNYPIPLAADGDPSVRGSDLSSGGIVAMTGGLLHSCGIADTGGLKCWGDGFSRSGAIVVPGLSADIEHLAAGSFHTCAALTDGTVWCGGRNVEGQLGNGTTASTDDMVQVVGLTDVVDVAAGQYSSCAETSDAIYCWGDNGEGQLGDGSTSSSATPVQVMSW